MNYSKNKLLLKKILPALCGLGLLFFILGLSFIYIEQEMSPLAIGLTVIGALSSISFYSLILNLGYGDLKSRQLIKFSARARWKRFVIPKVVKDH